MDLAGDRGIDLGFTACVIELGLAVEGICGNWPIVRPDEGICGNWLIARPDLVGASPERKMMPCQADQIVECCFRRQASPSSFLAQAS